MDSDNFAGFDPRVQDQLAQLSLNHQARRPSQSSQSAVSQASSYYSTHSTQIHPRGGRYPRTSRNHNSYQRQAPPGPEAFPLLGSPAPVADMAATYYAPPLGQSQQHGQYDHRRSAAQEFFSRARGRGRGRVNGPTNSRSSVPLADNWSRPPPVNNPQLFDPNVQRVKNQKLMTQVDYLEAVANAGATNMLSRDEIQAKQRFAQRLQSIVQTVVHSSSGLANAAQQLQVKLEPYGSLANSFGTTGCDVDLLLTISTSPFQYIDVAEEVKRDLEKALLEAGIGARLLTNTRIPILKVCESPSATLLHNLQQHRSNWDNEVKAALVAQNANEQDPALPDLSDAQLAVQDEAVSQLDVDAATIALPQTPTLNHFDLEFSGDCGIQCDINFTNHVALHNSKLLWTYGQLDKRVRIMGIFIKNWAKARDINTPYRGTLSSYGYILIVLHYLMNVAQPPLIPNLQALERDRDWNQDPQLFEGHDIRFARDLNQVKRYMASNMPRNNSSVGGLLVGFFRYYATNQAGFRWNEQVISIRTPQGILTKQDKGWTKAKWSDENPNVRQRYLLAIEDPFEIDHNVGRTVGHHGLVAIRDEFRRAWTLIEAVKIERGPNGPIWVSERSGSSVAMRPIDFIEQAESRGDTLRKDADERRAKLRQMRENLEQQNDLVKKQALEAQFLDANGEPDENGMWFDLFPDDDNQMDEVLETVSLIHNQQHQDEKVNLMRGGKTRLRSVVEHDDDDDSEHKTRIDTGDSSMWPQSNKQQSISESPSLWRSDSMDPLHSQNHEPWTSEESENTHDDAPEQHGEQATNFVGGGAQADIADDPPQNTITSEVMNPQILDADTPELGAALHMYNKPHNVDAVGEYIDWTRNCKAGLWLRKRDAMIRAGYYKPSTAGDLGRLHAKFPYEPSMTLEDLSKLNHILETQYKHSMYPQMPVEDNANSAEHEKVFVDITNGQDPSWEPPEKTEHWTAAPDIRSWPVRGDIPWSGETETGQWLLWRDRKLRQRAGIGNGRRHKNLGLKLNELFPFDAAHTIANIERMNAELDTYFSNLVFPRQKDMSWDEADAYAAAIHEAIEETQSNRQALNLATKQSEIRTIIDQVYPKTRRVRFSEAIDRDDVDAGSSRLELKSDPFSTANRWTSKNHVGRWLNERDDSILVHKWQSCEFEEGSICYYLDSLYPFQHDIDTTKRNAQNDEIEAFFADIELPSQQKPHVSAEGAFKALLKIQAHRGQVTERATETATESNRISFLLNHFREETLDGLRQATRNHGAERHDIDSRGSYNRAVQPAVNRGANSQLPEKMSHSSNPRDTSSTVRKINEEVTDFVRQRRIAFFQSQDTSTTADENSTFEEKACVKEKPSEGDEFVLDKGYSQDYKSDAECFVRRDSAAEGSWNLSPSSSQGSHHGSDLLVSHTNLVKCHLESTPSSVLRNQQPVKLQEMSFTNQKRSQKSNHEPRTKKTQQLPSNEKEPNKSTTQSCVPMILSGETDSNSDESSASKSDNLEELVPNSLDPDSWRENRKARFESPFIIPILQKLDLRLDPRQMADIDAIRAGGNGCVRGQSPFILESDLHSWGGGGAMARSIDSVHWSWSSQARTKDTDMNQTRRDLLEELPTLFEL